MSTTNQMLWHFHSCWKHTEGLWPVMAIFWLCSEGGGQYSDHHHCLSCGRSHCIDNGLHAAQEFHSFCYVQAGGEKVCTSIHPIDLPFIHCSLGRYVECWFAHFRNLISKNILLISIPLTVSLLYFCSKECLVTSSGIDNTENGLSGSKADSKPTPKKK